MTDTVVELSGDSTEVEIRSGPDEGHALDVILGTAATEVSLGVGAAPGAGASLAALLAAIQVSPQVVDGIRLHRAVANSVLTISLGHQQGPPPHQDVGPYYVATKATNGFVAADFTGAAGVSDQNDHSLATPAALWADAARRFIAFAQPVANGAFTHVYVYPHGVPNDQNRLGTSWEVVVATLIINGVECNWIRTRGAQRSNARGLIVDAS